MTTKYDIEQLASWDNFATKTFLDSGSLQTRKFPCNMTLVKETDIGNPKSMKEFKFLMGSYKLAMETVDFKPASIKFSRDNKTSFAVFAKTKLRKGDRVCGLSGFLSPIDRANYIEEGINDFSVFQSLKDNKDKVMLGPASLINSSCEPNCRYDTGGPHVKIEVTKNKGIKPGEELTVFYGDGYFGEGNEFCQCPFTEYHGRKVSDNHEVTGIGPTEEIVLPERLQSNTNSHDREVSVDQEMTVIVPREEIVPSEKQQSNSDHQVNEEDEESKLRTVSSLSSHLSSVVEPAKEKLGRATEHKVCPTPSKSVDTFRPRIGIVEVASGSNQSGESLNTNVKGHSLTSPRITGSLSSSANQKGRYVQPKLKLRKIMSSTISFLPADSHELETHHIQLRAFNKSLQPFRPLSNDSGVRSILRRIPSAIPFENRSSGSESAVNMSTSSDVSGDSDQMSNLRENSPLGSYSDWDCVNEELSSLNWTDDQSSRENSISDLMLPIPRCSTPLGTLAENVEFESYRGVFKESGEAVSDSSQLEDHFLFEGSLCTGEDFKFKFHTLSSKHCWSDQCAKDVFQLVRSILPVFNELPKFAAMKKPQKTLLSACEDYKALRGDWLFLPFHTEIKIIVKHYCELFLRQIERLGQYKWDKNPIKNDTFRLTLSLNADGVPLTKSNKCSMWPIWLMLNQLPLAVGSSKDNIVLAALWVSYEGAKPLWTPLGKHMKGILDNEFQLFHLHHLGKRYRVQVEVSQVIVDLPAKAAFANMTQYNGYNGCTVCYQEGTYLTGSKKMVYGYEKFKLRTRSSHQYDLKKAKELKRKYRGVKGKAPMSSLVGIPFKLSIDLMHQFSHGAAKKLSKFFYKSLSKANKKSINEILETMHIPSDFKRKPRTFAELKQFKASEIKMLFLHIIPLLLEGIIPDNQFKLLINLCFGIRILLNPVHISMFRASAWSLIDNFSRNLPLVFGLPFCNYNCHSMRHFAKQTDVFGPLSRSSAMCFESANHHLKRPFTGTKNHLKIITERYLQERTILRRGTGDFLKKCRNFLQIENQKEIAFLHDPNPLFYSKIKSSFINLNSLSYTRRGRKADHRICYIESSRKAYGEIVVFVEERGLLYAIIRKLEFLHLPYVEEPVPEFFGEIRSTNSFTKIAIGDILHKFVSLTIGKDVYASEISEEFEDN